LIASAAECPEKCEACGAGLIRRQAPLYIETDVLKALLKARIAELEAALRPFATGPHARMCGVEDCEETAEAKRALGLEGTFSKSELTHGRFEVPANDLDTREKAIAAIFYALRNPLMLMSVPDRSSVFRLARRFLVSAEDLLEHAVRRARNT
jgi:hypothetical protein